MNGKRCGIGEFKGVDGNTYKGQWKDNLRHGNGQYTWANGDIYSGQWLRNEMHGEGVFDYHNGDVYSGKFLQGRKHGQGSLCSRGVVHNQNWLMGAKSPWNSIPTKIK